MGTIVEKDGQGQRVLVMAGDGQDVEGTVVRGIIEGRTPAGRVLFDLDSPFWLKTEDGERVRVSSPWNCRISYLDEEV